MKPKLSCVIPHWPDIEGAEEALELLLKSIEDQEVQIIVQHNEGIGFAKAVNQGMKHAYGDYIIVANNDTYLQSGDLYDLCGAINSIYVPTINPIPRDEYPRCFYCIPREIYLSIVRDDGYFYDERFQMGYFEDDDLIKRLKNKGIAFLISPDVHVHHIFGGGLTMKQIGEQKYFDINKKNYEDKWGN